MNKTTGHIWEVKWHEWSTIDVRQNDQKLDFVQAHTFIWKSLVRVNLLVHQNSFGPEKAKTIQKYIGTVPWRVY